MKTISMTLEEYEAMIAEKDRIEKHLDSVLNDLFTIYGPGGEMVVQQKAEVIRENDREILGGMPSRVGPR